MQCYKSQGPSTQLINLNLRMLPSHLLNDLWLSCDFPFKNRFILKYLLLPHTKWKLKVSCFVWKQTLLTSLVLAEALLNLDPGATNPRSTTHFVAHVEAHGTLGWESY